MLQDLPPLRAVVLLSKQLTKAKDDASRRAIIRMMNNIRRNRNDQPEDEELVAGTTSRLGRRIIRALGDQKLKAKSIARLCGLSYTGSFRAALTTLVKTEKLEKLSNFYTKKCPSIAKTVMSEVS